MSKNNNCPKCGKKLSPFYMKQNCPNCNINLLYYKMDERLEADAKKAKREVDSVRSFLGIIKDSTISDVWHIIRLIVFFLPLATMCAPMFWAGHKNLSLISLVMCIVNHGLDIGAWDTDYLIGALAIVFVIVLSLVVIIGSLFSSARNGATRDMLLSSINSTVLCVLSIVACASGAKARLGLYLTVLVLIIESVLHYVVSNDKAKIKKMLVGEIAGNLVFIIGITIFFNANKPIDKYVAPESNGGINVVSFNVASAFGTSFEDLDSMTRCQRFVDYMKAVEPELIGTQEMNSYWLDYIDKNIDGYTTYGIKRGGDGEEKNSEMNAVMWKTDAFEEIEKNTFWLSETPDKESKYTYTDENGEQAEAGCNRICSYAVLKKKDDNKLLLFMNTHLDNASEQARVFGASVIMQNFADIRVKYGEDISVVLTGDFNEYADDEACRYLAGILNDTNISQKEQATYQEWGYASTGDKPIDFIYTTGQSINYDVLDDIHNGYISDHYGILSTINL